MDSNDSTQETEAHIQRVQELFREFIVRLEQRALVHDASKLQPPEKEGFDKHLGNIKGLTYGNQDYLDSLNTLKITLEHHYLHNTHHPEHYEKGIDGMSLLDIVELFLDHKASSERHSGGSMLDSLEYNRKRFGYSDQLYSIFHNTIKELGWDK